MQATQAVIYKPTVGLVPVPAVRLVIGSRNEIATSQ